MPSRWFSLGARRISRFAARPSSLPVWTMALAGLRPRHLSQAGPKAVALGRLLQAGLPVPPGFVLTTAAYRRFLEAANGWEAVRAACVGLDPAAIAEAEALTRRIHEVLLNTPIPAEVAQAIGSATEAVHGGQLWAVRSSATAEDLPEASFAGQHDSFLNVPRDQLPARVRECWISLFSVRALRYRLKHGIPQDGVAMAVILQPMIPAECSGVLFTADPISGYTSRMVIEATQGLGDRLVSGRTNPESVILARRTLRVVRRRMTPGGSDLGEALVRRLGKLGREVDHLFGGPQDVEWAVAGGEVFLLQARPITAKPAVRSWEDRQVWSNLNAGEVMPDVMTPATWSIIRLFLGQIADPLFQFVGADCSRAPVVGVVAGRAYFNVNTGLAAMKPFAGLLGRIPNFAQALGGGQIELYRQGLMDIPDEDLPDLGFGWGKYILSWPRVLRSLLAHSPRRGDAWTVRLKAQCDTRVGVNLEAMSTPELGRFLEELLRDSFQGWDLLYLGTQGACLPVFQRACHDWLDDPKLTLGYRLFAGLGGLPETEAALALWRLAAQAHADGETEAVLLSGDRWLSVSAQLRRIEHGRQFLAVWEGFMSEHGHHCRGELELNNPRWSETPDYILGLVRGYLRAIDQPNPEEKQRRLALERQQLTGRCRSRLRNPIKRWVFCRALRRAQRLAVNREVWKDQAVRHLTVLRRVLLQLGDRLWRDGKLDRPADIFFLELTEMGPTIRNQAPFDVKAMIAQRRAEYERNLTLAPPSGVVGRFDPTAPAPQAPQCGNGIIEGIPVSPGIATGRARVILRADDHEHVLPGEILIAPFTDPAWTPYFLPAAGVAMDLGGILSHGSIVAREFGLPAVTNLGSATKLIRTGDLVEVDGNRGRVTVVERAEDRKD